MSKITFELGRLDVKEKGNYFLLIQIDETEYPSKLVSTKKFRTEIDYTTEFPDFQKNIFEFENVHLGNKIQLKIGLFNLINVHSVPQVQKETKANTINPKILFNNSELIGQVDILLDQIWIESLREHKYVDCDKILMHPEIKNYETGHIFFKLSVVSQTTDTKIWEDENQLKKCQYDPFEDDAKEINRKLKMIIILNEEKQLELEKKQKEVDEANNSMKFAIRNKEECIRELKFVEEENRMLRKNLAKIQSIDEIDIEVDLLCQSPQGLEIMKKRYAVLLGQLKLQQMIREEYENYYMNKKNLMSKINIISNRFKTLKDANEELKFNYKLHNDLLPLIQTYIDKINNNNKIIKNIRENIIDVINLRHKNSTLSLNEINKRIEQYSKERKKLEEKRTQMNLFLDIYMKGYKVTKSNTDIFTNFDRIIGLDPTMNKIKIDGENEILSNNLEYIKELKLSISNLSKKISDFEQREKEKKEKGIIIEPSLIMKRNNLKMQVNDIDKKEKELISEANKNKEAYINAKEALKDKIADLDRKINKELKIARIRRYEDELNQLNQRYFDYI